MSISVPANVRREPEAPFSVALYVVPPFSIWNVPELVIVPVNVYVELAVLASSLIVAPLLIVVVPITVMLRLLVSSTPLAPCPTTNVPPTVKALVARETVEPLLI